MLNVTDETKKIYERDGIHKSMRIYFPDLDLTYENDRIVSDTFQLTESINSGTNLEFVGCIASVMSVELADLKEDVKDQRIEVYITADGSEEIPLFHGRVDSAKKQSYKNHKQIEAYDKLYELSETDISSWYNNHIPTTVERLFIDLMEYLGIEVESYSLVNGKQRAYCQDSQVAESLAALDLLKSICQINGVFGRINRNGKFETFSLDASDTVLLDIQDHENMQHEEFSTKLIDSVILRESASDGGIEYGGGDNKYIIQGNMFAVDWTSTELAVVAENIFNLISYVTYIPFEADTYGLPFVECGDQVSFQDVDLSDLTSVRKNFFVFSRTINGINGMRDSFSAEGTEVYDNVTSSVSTNISSIKSQMGEYNLIRFKFQNARQLLLDSTELFIGQLDVSTKLARPFFLCEAHVVVTPNTTSKSVGGTVVIDEVETETTFNYTEDTPVELSVRYTLNGEEISWYPVETLTAGDHILNLMYFLGDMSNGSVLGIYMTATGGTITIEPYSMYAVLMGQGKATAAVEWNGLINIEETVNILKVQDIANIVPIRDAVEVTFNTSTVSGPSDIISPIDAHSLIKLAGLTDGGVTFSEVVTNWTMISDKIANYEYDETYVEVVDSALKLRTEYEFSGEEQTIDEGRLFSVSTPTDVFNSVDNLNMEVTIEW